MNKPKASVIIPTTGSEVLIDSVKSVLNQTIPSKIYLVVDGIENAEKVYYQLNSSFDTMDVFNKINITVLFENVGKNGFYGHRIYAAFTHLVDSDYVLYLDQDCFYENNHVESLINTIEGNGLDWAYSLRNIVNKSGDYICKDDCESLGKWNPVLQYNHVDTNCYCIRTEIAIKVCQLWHGGWGQDRIFYKVLSDNFKQYGCNGEYTLNYRLDGNESSVKENFFIHNNNEVYKKCGNNLPWISGE